MKIFELIFMALGVSIDAFTVSLTKGLESTKSVSKTALICAGWFTVFQIIFPVAGYFFGYVFESFIMDVDHWIMFAVFFALGVNMFREAFSKKEEKIKNDLSFKSMFFLSLAISLDSLAVGMTLAFVGANIFLAIFFICLFTFLATILGVIAGNKCGKKYKKQATIAGGVLLIALSIEVLISHIFL